MEMHTVFIKRRSVNSFSGVDLLHSVMIVVQHSCVLVLWSITRYKTQQNILNSLYTRANSKEQDTPFVTDMKALGLVFASLNCIRQVPVGKSQIWNIESTILVLELGQESSD